jgi:plasmid replication initiation protein
MLARSEDMPPPAGRALKREQLDLFRALPGDLAPRDAQDLMAYPFFSLAKSKRLAPIDFKAGSIAIRVEAVPEHGMATIWDADVLIWAASQMAERRRHRFSWINEWKETADANGRALGIELILPDWFYAGVLEDALVLTIDRTYFSLTGGLERWLYRIVRKHGGRQDYGWSFDFGHLHAKSGSLSPLKHFVYDIREIVRRQPLPGYSLKIERSSSGAERLSFKPSSIDPLAEAPRRCRASQPAGDKL